MTTVGIKLEDKVYSRKELIDAIVKASEEMFKEDCLYESQPIDPDNFYTDYAMYPKKSKRF